MCGVVEPEVEVVRTGEWNPGKIGSPTLPAENKEEHYQTQWGRRAKVNALFANTAHMETPRPTLTNLILGWGQKQWEEI